MIGQLVQERSRFKTIVLMPLLMTAALAVTGPVEAQSWTLPAFLGKTSQGKPSLAMGGAGVAVVAFNYTGNSGTAAGTIYEETIQGSQTWTTAPVAVTSSIDPYNVGVGMDVGGSAFMAFGAGQWDNLPSAYLGCLQSPGTGWCRELASYGASQHPPAVQFFGASTVTPNTAVYLLAEKCQLVAADTAGGSAGVLTQAGDCVSQFSLALAPSGSGAAVFKTTTGAIEAVARTAGASGAWGTTTVLAAANPLDANFAVAAAPSGEATVAWTVGKSGKPYQVWTVTLSASGVWGPAVEITANACDAGTGVAMSPNGDTLIALAAHGKSCEASVVSRPEGGVFSPPVALTAGAHAKQVTAVATAGGNFVVAWSEGPAPMVRASSGTLTSFSAPQTVGSYAGAPVLAAAGGYVNAAWCATACYASTLILP
jgi:hypothetical protein